MSRFNDVLSGVEDGLAGFSLAVAAILAILQVILRYVFGVILFWSEEAIVYLVIFSTFTGAAITLRHNEHVSVDVLGLLLGRLGKRCLAVVGALITVIYCAVIGGFGWLMITEPALVTTVTPALGLPLWIVYLSLPVGLTLMFIRSLELVYHSARGQEISPGTDNSEYGEEVGL